MDSYDEDRIPEILKKAKTVAVVGISDKPDRDSYRVASYLRDAGYTIIPVNPVIGEWNGIKSYDSLLSIPSSVKVDVVDVFRKPDAAIEVAKEASNLKPYAVWFQEGVINKEAAEVAKKSGSLVVMDRCMMKEHSRHFGKR